MATDAPPEPEQQDEVPELCPECGEPYRRVRGGRTCRHLPSCKFLWRPKSRTW